MQRGLLHQVSPRQPRPRGRVQPVQQGGVGRRPCREHTPLQRSKSPVLQCGVHVGVPHGASAERPVRMVRRTAVQLRHGGTGGQQRTGEALLHSELSLAVPRQPSGQQRPVGRLRPVPQAQPRAVPPYDERRICSQFLQLFLRSWIPGTVCVPGDVVGADSQSESHREQCKFGAANTGARGHQQIRDKIKRHVVLLFGIVSFARE